MHVLVGKRKVLKPQGFVYVTCDGFFTTSIKMTEDRAENIPIAILSMYIEPELLPIKALKKSETILVIDIDSRELLIKLALITNTRIENKIQSARDYAARMPYLEIQKYDMQVTRFQDIYERYNLQNCLADVDHRTGKEEH
jgi:hypothetical protein